MFRTIIDRLLKRDRSSSRKLSRAERREAFLNGLRNRTAAEVAILTLRAAPAADAAAA